MNIEFENELLKLGYTIEDCTDLCECKNENKNIVFYQQNVIDHYPEAKFEKDLPFMKCIVCENCYLSAIDSLSCGGWYHNFRSFDILNNKQLQSTLDETELNPDAKLD